VIVALALAAYAVIGAGAFWWMRGATMDAPAGERDGLRLAAFFFWPLLLVVVAVMVLAGWDGMR
jgi:hypothetical protein